VKTRGWGYTLITRGFGLLLDDFPDPYIRVFDLSNGEFAYLRDDIAIPIEPFFGSMGVCPAGATQQAVMPPGRFGGNMDTRQLVRGTTLYLPVEVPGALVSCGDAHAAQGDGEVCVVEPAARAAGPLYRRGRCFNLERQARCRCLTRRRGPSTGGSGSSCASRFALAALTSSRSARSAVCRRKTARGSSLWSGSCSASVTACRPR
jgi:Acetamidase/Formamidase family